MPADAAVLTGGTVNISDDLAPPIGRHQTLCLILPRRERPGRLWRAAAVIATCLVAGCAPTPLPKDTDATSIDDTPHITVLGEAVADVTPDTAEIRLGVTTEKPTAAEAWEAVSTLGQVLVDAAKATGVKPQDIGTTRIDLSQRYDTARQPDGTTTNVSRGFQASYMLRVRSSGFDKIGSLTQTLIAKGANSFEGVSFSSTHPEALRDKLRGEAMRDARHQAEILADAAGVKLGALLQVERPDQVGAAVRPLTRSLAAAAMPVEPGTQTMSAEVEATYAIE